MIEPKISREYVRTDHWSVIARISREEDSEQWIEVKVPNMAAGGLLFLTDLDFSCGDELWFDMSIDPLMPGLAGKIPMKVKGAVRGDRGHRDGMHAYSVEFLVISKSDRIRLDELVRMTNIKYTLDSESGIFDR